MRFVKMMKNEINFTFSIHLHIVHDICFHNIPLSLSLMHLFFLSFFLHNIFFSLYYHATICMYKSISEILNITFYENFPFLLFRLFATVTFVAFFCKIDNVMHLHNVQRMFLTQKNR